MTNRAQLFIDLDLDATPIAGYITSDQDDRRPFHGWLALSTAIEQRRIAGPKTADLTARPVEPLLPRLTVTRAGAHAQLHTRARPVLARAATSGVETFIVGGSVPGWPSALSDGGCCWGHGRVPGGAPSP